MSQKALRKSSTKLRFLCERLSDLGEIGLILILDCKCREYVIWKEMIERHHFLDSDKLYGR